MKQVLLPLQGPEDLEAAVRLLQLKPFHEAVELSLLTVLPAVHPPWPVGGNAAEELEKQVLQSARDFIEDAVGRLQSLGYQARGRAVLGTPSDMILREASTLRAELILMGSRGRKGVARFVLGSVSHAVLHRMPCPVLIFH
jgi:nucleotide-binding universal stress UspA family protein